MNQPDTDHRPSFLRTVVVVLLIALVAGVLVFWINSTEPKAQREAATKKTAMLVDVLEVQSGTHRPVIETLGKVRAARDVALSPQVSGYVTDVSENFVPGGFVREGDILVTLDDADFRNALRQAESDLAKAQADLSLELGRQDSATREFELIEQELTDENRSLVLREPQLNSARSAVLAARAAVDQAQLNLERTRVRAPFDAHILERHIHLGSRVDPSSAVAQLIGINEYWVEASVPVASLKDIALPERNEPGASARIRHRAAWPEGTARQGEVIKLIGALDNTTRLARLLIRISDPLNRLASADSSTDNSADYNTDNSVEKPPVLLLDAVVQASIQGYPLENVFRIPRNYLRQDNTLWLNRNNELVISEATLVTKDKHYVYLSDGLRNGDLLITSNLATIASGTPLRTAEESSE